MGKMFDNAVCTRIWDASPSVMWLKLMPVVCSVLAYVGLMKDVD